MATQINIPNNKISVFSDPISEMIRIFRSSRYDYSYDKDGEKLVIKDEDETTPDIVIFGRLLESPGRGIVTKILIRPAEDGAKPVSIKLGAENTFENLLNATEAGSGAPTPVNYPLVYQFLKGPAGSEDVVVTGSSKADNLQSGVTEIHSGNGNDYIQIFSPMAVLDGGKGKKDHADFSFLSSKVGVDLSSGLYSTGSTGSITRIEFITGTDADDRLTGDNQKNSIWGGKASDLIKGLGGNDKLWGNTGADEIDGGDGNDIVDGGGGGDTIMGGTGDDKLRGKSGNDTISGGTGDDTLSGGGGKDAFVFSAGDGDDVVTDFNLKKDAIMFDSMVQKEDVSVQKTMGNTVITVVVDGFDTGTVTVLDANLNISDLVFS